MEKSLFSTVTSQIPLVNYTDGNRIQMASSMIRQHQDLINPDIPIISTFNSTIFVNSFFTQRAKHDGKIIDKTSNYIIVEYDNGEKDAFIIQKYPSFTITSKDVGDQISKNELIVYHKSYDENYGLLKFGKNAHVMFSSYTGDKLSKDLNTSMCGSYTYEDAIVLSSDGVDKFTSYYYDKIMVEIYTNKEFVELLVDLKPGIVLPKGNIMKIKYISNKLSSALYTPNETVIYNKHDNFIITDINVYIKDKKAVDNCKLYSDRFREFINTYNIENKYKNKLAYDKAKINFSYDSVMFIEIVGYKYHKPEIGDKFANLWGNKGVVSYIDKNITLNTKDGKFNIDLVHTPLGIPSRMNASQIVYMNFGYFLKYKIPQIIKDMSIMDAFKFIMKLYAYIDKNAYKYILSIFNNIEDKDKFILDVVNDVKTNGLHMMLSSFTYNIVQRIYNVLKEYDSPIYGYYKDYKLGFGVIYTMKLEHFIEKKIKARGISTYDRKTLQPNKDSQRIGEMEIWSIAAYDAINLLRETLTIKSDDIDGKSAALHNILTSGATLFPENDSNPGTLDLFKAYMMELGIDIKTLDDINH